MNIKNSLFIPIYYRSFSVFLYCFYIYNGKFYFGLYQVGSNFL